MPVPSVLNSTCYQITRHLLGYVGYSHFFTGAFINRSGPGRDSDFVYAVLQYTF